MVQVFRKINYVNTESDGLIISSKPKIYNISGTDEVSKLSSPIPIDTRVELYEDYDRVVTNIDLFYNFMGDTDIIIDTYSLPKDFIPTEPGIFASDSDKAFFMVMAQVFNNISNLNTFRDLIITDDMDKQTSGLLRKFNKIVDDFKDKVKDELKAEKKQIKDVKKSDTYSNFTKVETLYKKGKTRKFTYTTEISPQNEEKISNLNLLYQGNNSGDNTTWTDKTQFN